MRTDPTENGGLFIGRRPGTRPIRYRDTPEAASRRRQRIDSSLALVLLLLMGFVCLSFWGPLPAAWLWVAGHVQYWTGSVSAAILTAFAGLMASLLIALVTCKRLDQAWILVRRAAGYDQRHGTLPRIFAVTCGLGTIVFTGWLLLFSGTELAPLGIGVG